jgi:hypothetical protein
MNYWQCPGGCPIGKIRHVLAPCPTCGTKYQGISCTNPDCEQPIAFDDPYNEFEILNRDKKYVTRPNPHFYIALLALDVFAVTAYSCLENQLTILGYSFGTLAIATGISLLIFKPKRLVPNPYYQGQEESEWTRNVPA